MDGHDEDNWCSQKCLLMNWTYGDKKPVMSYGGEKPIMSEGGSASSASSRTESCADGIMLSGGRNSDFSRLEGDLCAMSG